MVRYFGVNECGWRERGLCCLEGLCVSCLALKLSGVVGRGGEQCELGTKSCSTERKQAGVGLGKGRAM